jgi:sec-independent protein translocase protein TatB
MPGFGDTTFIVLLALLLFGPKKLPVLARQLGKLMADFRRASNEFKTQMEEELRISEQAERQKQITALEAAAPKQIDPVPEPEHPHLPPPMESESSSIPEHSIEASVAQEGPYAEPSATTYPSDPYPSDSNSPVPESAADSAPGPLPIASSGSINLMPPVTGLPIARSSSTIRTPITETLPEVPSQDSAAEPVHSATADQTAEPRPVHG